MRGVSSYSGWKHWSDYIGMYRKRKQSTSDVDVEAIKEVKSQVIEEITKRSQMISWTCFMTKECI